MALSRRDVILASIAAFIGWAWITHWIPTFRLIPYAFLTGVLGTVVASTYILLTTSRGLHQDASEPFPRTSFLSLTTPNNWHHETKALEERLAYNPQPIYPASPTVSHEIDNLLDLARRDFVTSWYSKISPGHAFSNQVDAAIRTSFNAILSSIFAVDLVQFGVTRLLPIINTHVKNFREAERQIRGKKLNLDITETSELDIAIAGKYRDGRLHPAASLAASKTTALQQQHLRRVAAAVLPKVLPSYMMSSSSVLVLIREILACAILLPVMVLISDPDVLNQLLEMYGRSLSHERKTVRKLRAALDEASSPMSNSSKPSSFLKLLAGDSERNFERFIRSIRQCTSISDARRFRSEIARQIKKDGPRQDCDLTYLRRLEIGRKLLDQKVLELSTTQPVRPKHFRQESKSSDADTWSRENASLHQVLYDASGLSYFMEYMDRLKSMTLVQFWIVVDGLRTPLEGLDNGENSTSWNESDRQDLIQISTSYLHRPELHVSQESQRKVQSFLDAGEAATNSQFNVARQTVLEVQANVFQEMKDQYYPKFCQSDLFYKWLASDTTHVGLSSDDKASSIPAPARGIPKEISRDPLRQLGGSTIPRATSSSSDLVKTAQIMDRIDEPRRSFDDSATKRPLFDDDLDGEPLSRSTPSLINQETPANKQNNGAKSAIDAVQAALDDLVEQNGESESMTSSWMGPDAPDSPRVSLDDPRMVAAALGTDNHRPSLASLGLLGTPSRPTVFSQGDLFGENEKLWEDDDGGEETNRRTAEEEDIHEAAPGDLGLTEVVETMTLEIERLEAQQAIVDSLTKKAELINNTAELRILRKSKTSLEREIRHKELQRQQYIIQKSENDLYSRASVSIKSIMVGTESDGHEFALYVIEVQRHAGESAPAVTWAIARRYSEFHDLHRRLRSKFPEVKDLEFPRRQVVVTLQRDFLKKRRIALERYLRELLAKPAICRSIEFRAFLSQQTIRPTSQSDGNQIDKQDFITRIYNSVTDGMEEFLGNVPVLDQLSLAGQNLITAATSYPSTSQLGSTPALAAATTANPMEAAEAEAELAAFETTRDPETVTFIKPICDAFVEMFQLNQGNNWLRGRALVVVVQQLLGGTIERRVRDTYRALTSEDNIVHSIGLLKTTMWPDGKLRASPPIRSEAEKTKTRKEAGLILASLLPDLAGNVVGRGNAAEAARRIFATLNNERLNQHLLYTILDEVVETVFGVRVGSAKL